MEHTAAPEALPFALARIHRETAVGERLDLTVNGEWNHARLARVLAGAGFDVVSNRRSEAGRRVRAIRLRTLPDTVGPRMRGLVVGLNPSVYSADAGVGFARPGNRFWPAALASGLMTRDRDNFHALRVDRVGMTDLVKRATARADELADDEYRSGALRLAVLVEWLRPRAVCFVGLSGYRVAIDRRAVAGWQATRFGGRPAYVMPNPSGLNARATPAVLAEHLHGFQLGPPR